MTHGGSSLATAQALLHLVGGERETKQRGRGSLEGGVPGPRESSQNKHLEYLGMQREHVPEEEGQGEGEETPLWWGEWFLGAGSSWYVLQVRALGQTLQSPPPPQGLAPTPWAKKSMAGPRGGGESRGVRVGVGGGDKVLPQGSFQGKDPSTPLGLLADPPPPCRRPWGQ